MMRLTVVAMLVAMAFAGCAQHGAEWDGLWHVRAAGVTVDAAPGAVSTIRSHGAPVEVVLPERSLVLDEGRWWPQSTLHLLPDEEATWLPQPWLDSITIETTLGRIEIAVDRDDHDRLFDGMNVVERIRHQQHHFPNRNIADPNTPLAFGWAAEEMAAMGLDVEIDPYGFYDAPPPADAACYVPEVGPASPGRICPFSYANVVGARPGTDGAGRMIIVGGHYDLVPQTTYGAMDNTAGSMVTLEMARVMSEYTTGIDLRFGLWGGEEDGLIGSEFWVRSNLDRLGDMHSYMNYDALGITWPAPLPAAAPIEFIVGPDNDCSPRNEVREPLCPLVPMSPAAESVVAWAEEVTGSWANVPAGDGYFVVTEPRRDTGGGSDVIAFMRYGVPGFYPSFYGDNLVRWHTDQDTLQNMSKQALWGLDFDIAQEGWESPQVRREAEKALARSFEPYMWIGFYHIVLSDAGLWDPPVAPLSLLPA